MSIRTFVMLAVLALPFTTGATEPPPAQPPAAEKKPPEAKVETCEHGVQKSLCTRCNPKLEAVFKSRGDWCAEHGRPESQCALCDPELAKKGVK